MQSLFIFPSLIYMKEIHVKRRVQKNTEEKYLDFYFCVRRSYDFYVFNVFTFPIVFLFMLLLESHCASMKTSLYKISPNVLFWKWIYLNIFFLLQENQRENFLKMNKKIINWHDIDGYAWLAFMVNERAW